jgi:hypothetical protein
MVMNEHIEIIKELLESGYVIYQYLERLESADFASEYVGQYNYESTIFEYKLGKETKTFELVEGAYLYAIMYVSEIADGNVVLTRYQPINNTYELAIDVEGLIVYADIVMHEVDEDYFDNKYNLLKALQDNVGYILLNLPEYID